MTTEERPRSQDRPGGSEQLAAAPPERKELVAAYVLHDFHKVDQDWLDDLIRGISDGAVHLAAGDASKFQNAVALRVAPPRSSGGGSKTSDKTPAPKAETKPSTEPEEADTSNPLQRLVDKFR